MLMMLGLSLATSLAKPADALLAWGGRRSPADAHDAWAFGGNGKPSPAHDAWACRDVTSKIQLVISLPGGLWKAKPS